jgi:predicted nucleic acid-binding protein
MGDIIAVLRSHRLVGFDTSVFIYYLEKSSRYTEIAAITLDALVADEFAGITSVLTLMEIAVMPLQIGKPEVADIYGVSLNALPNLTIAAIDGAIARRAAELRATYQLSPPGTVHVAACLQHGATAFVTNDKALRRIVEIETVLLEDFVDDNLTLID